MLLLQLASFCCHMMMMMLLSHPRVDDVDDVISASC
jgi:hypothetical protein